MISSLLHLVDLVPRVYYTLTNFRGGGGKAPLPPPQYANVQLDKIYIMIYNNAIRSIRTKKKCDFKENIFIMLQCLPPIPNF